MLMIYTYLAQHQLGFKNSLTPATHMQKHGESDSTPQKPSVQELEKQFLRNHLHGSLMGTEDEALSNM